MNCPRCGGTDLRDMGHLPHGERIVHAWDCKDCGANLAEERTLVVVVDPDLLRRMGVRERALQRLDTAPQRDTSW